MYKPNSNPFFILFNYATKGRPGRFFDGMDSIYNNLADKENFHVLIAAGEDDPLMNNPEVINRLKNDYPNSTIEFGENTGKVQATNRNFLKPGIWEKADIIINMADDMRFNLLGFDTIIRVDMNALFPNFDGLLHYPDLDAREYVPVLYVAGRNYFEKRGRVVAWPEYKSLWWDNDDMEYSKLLGKYAFVGTRLFDHLCPAYGHLERDKMFDRDQSLWPDDEATYHRRKAINFGLTQEEIVLK